MRSSVECRLHPFFVVADHFEGKASSIKNSWTVANTWEDERRFLEMALRAPESMTC